MVKGKPPVYIMDPLPTSPWPHEPAELRWAVDTKQWEPGTREWYWLLRLLPPREQLEVHALGSDHKTAIVSRLLVRKCIATMLGKVFSPTRRCFPKRTAPASRRTCIARARVGGWAGGRAERSAGGHDSKPIVSRRDRPLRRAREPDAATARDLPASDARDRHAAASTPHARTPRPPQVLRRIADVHGFSDFDGVRGALHGGGDDDDDAQEEEAKAEERAPLLFPGVRRA